MDSNVQLISSTGRLDYLNMYIVYCLQCRDQSAQTYDSTADRSVTNDAHQNSNNGYSSFEHVQHLSKLFPIELWNVASLILNTKGQCPIEHS